MQAAFNARFTVEICDPDTEESRRDALARAVRWIMHQIHAYGIGTANRKGGWYARLKQALDADIARLANDRERGLIDYGESRRWLLLGDLGMAALVVAFAVLLVVRAICG